MGENIEQLQINPQQIITTIENALAQEYRVAGFTIHPSALAAQFFGALARAGPACCRSDCNPCKKHYYLNNLDHLYFSGLFLPDQRWIET